MKYQTKFVILTPLVATFLATNPLSVADVFASQKSAPSSNIVSLQQQVSLLEGALTPITAQDAVQNWARGVKTRNGALQFAVLSPQLRQQLKSKYQNLNWVTGVSNPAITGYRVMDTDRVQPKEIEFKIEYELSTSSEQMTTEIQTVTVAKLEGLNERQDGWYIIKFTPFPPYTP
jgi:hypothetical protein